MPVQFLSESDHERLNRFPEDITQEDLDRFFWLSQDDRQAIMGLRGAHNRLGLALLLCCLRYLGFFPETLREIPKGVVQYIAVQLQVSPDALSLYGKRSSTQRNHQRQVQILLGHQPDSVKLLPQTQKLFARCHQH